MTEARVFLFYQGRGTTAVSFLGVVNSLSQKLPVALLYLGETSLPLALNSSNEHHGGITRSHRGAIRHLFTMATRAGGGRQMGGGRRAASLCHFVCCATIVAADEG